MSNSGTGEATVSPRGGGEEPVRKEKAVTAGWTQGKFFK